MKITGYRIIPTVLDWGRRIGDVNGVMPGNETPSSVVLVETDSDVTGVAIGQGNLLDAVFPAGQGEDPRSVTALFDRMLAWTFKAGHSGSVYGAIGTIDLALWDIKAKAVGEPLWRLLGARDRAVPRYVSGLDAGLDDDQLHRLYTCFAQASFTTAKLKGGRNVEDDLRRLAVIRDALGADHPVLAVDANESWNTKQAVRYVAALEQSIDLAWVEEPVRRWDAAGLATVSRQVRAAVATGENLTGIDQYLPRIKGRAVDLVQAGGGWGISHFLRVAALAARHNLPVSPVGFFGHLAPAAAAVPNHALTEGPRVRPARRRQRGLGHRRRPDHPRHHFRQRPQPGRVRHTPPPWGRGAATSRPARTPRRRRPTDDPARLSTPPELLQLQR